MIDYIVTCSRCNTTHTIPGTAGIVSRVCRAQCPSDRDYCPPGNHTEHVVNHGGYP